MTAASLFLVTLFLLLGTCVLTAFSHSLRQLCLRKTEWEKVAGLLVWPKSLRHLCASRKSCANTLVVALCAQSLCRFSYIISSLGWLWRTQLPPFGLNHAMDASWFLSFGMGALYFSTTFVLGEIIPRQMGLKHPQKVFKTSSPLALIYLGVCLPLCWPLVKLVQAFVPTRQLDPFQLPGGEIVAEILEIIQELEVSPKLETHDKQLIESVVTFRHQLAREVMVPRVDVFSLQAKTSIRQAAHLLQDQGYSRTPVYGSTIDDIVGVLMHKDVMQKYMEAEITRKKEILDAPCETLLKKVLFTPETKKISLLLQEFRQKQVHLAVVVDEYGGTDGIITIEDILEQIVGEIADEYDEEEAMFVIKPEGGWVVDARMSLLDVEEKLDVDVPQEGDYDTLAGFVFHCSGSIPEQGFLIHRDNFELEVLNSNERMVESVWLKPIESGKTTEGA